MSDKPKPTHQIGDKVAAVTDALGIKKTRDCGCGRRQQALNEVRTDQSPALVARDVVKAILAPRPGCSVVVSFTTVPPVTPILCGQVADWRWEPYGLPICDACRSSSPKADMTVHDASRNVSIGMGRGSRFVKVT